MNSINNSKFNKNSTVKLEDFTSDEQKLLAARLDQQLGPEFVSTRPGAGGLRVSYIEGWKAINLANSLFGFNGWFSEVKTIQVDYLDERNGKFSVGLSIVVRITLKDGSFHEDIGYGSLDNARTKAMAFEKAKKEAMTDGLKRALRNFGNAMGNCLYDKDFLSKIAGVKCAPPDFDESNLMRLDNLSRPGTKFKPETTANQPQSHQLSPEQPQHSKRHGSKNLSNSSTAINESKQIIPEKRSLITSEKSHKRPSMDFDDAFDDSLLLSDDLVLESEDFNDEVNELMNAKLKTPVLAEDTIEGEQILETSESTSTTQEAQTDKQPNRDSTDPAEVTPTFFKARVAKDLQKNASVSSADIFNTQFISPSITRTLDPTKSTPVKRATVPEPKAIRYDNPRLIPNRQVGKPRYPPPRKLLNSDKDTNNGDK